MAVHPAGDGVAWTTDVDVDQPHGLDYRYTNHVAIGVASRSNKEHKTYADDTVGGEHLPGGCRILAIVDNTADMTVGVADASIDITDGQFIGRGLIYDQTNNSFWCWTADGTTTDNPYQIMFGPDSICLGGDFIWTGEIQFDGTVSHTDEMDVSVVNVDGTATFTSLVDMSTLEVQFIDGTVTINNRVDMSGVGITGDVSINGDLDVSGAVNIDGQLVLDTNNVYDSGAFDISKAGTYSKTHGLGSNLVSATLYCCSNTAGLACSSAWASLYESGANYGTMITDLSSNTVKVQASLAWPINRIGTNGTQLYDSSGYGRIIVTRLI